MSLTHLSDEALVASLAAVCGDERRLQVRLVQHLVEVEDRRLHLKAACSSMFDFCVRRLGMSEGSAFRRINAARLARRFPGLIGAIERGELHLSSLVMLRDHLTEANVEELVAATRGKNKREVEELLARRAPRPDVPSTLRRLPTPGRSAARSEVAVGTTTAALVSCGVAGGGEVTPVSLPLRPPARVPESAPLLPPVVPPARARARIEPLADARYKLQLTASAALRDKLERARDLMRHRNPAGDLAVVVERALDALLAQLEKERLGKAVRPRTTGHPTTTAPPSVSALPTTTAPPSVSALPTTTAPPSVSALPTRAGHVARAVRRAVFDRDGERCTFTDESGSRCPSRTFLELDHIEARALGGADEASNLRVRCRAHNALHAEAVFGRAHVAARVRLRQRKRCVDAPEPLLAALTLG